MKRIRIGVMGCANIAVRSTIDAIQKVKSLDLVAVASRSLDKANQVANQFNCEAVEGYQALLDRKDIDAIYMPLPTGLHEEWIIKSLNANKHVHVEKSFAMDATSAIKMVEIAKHKKLLITENFMFLHHSQHSTIMDMVSKGEIGELRLFRSSFGFPPFSDKENFRYNPELGGGALLDAAAYTVKAAQLFLGYDLEVIGSQLSFGESSRVDIHGSAYLVNNNRQEAQLGFGFDNFYQCNYELWGSKGKIIATKAFTPRPDQNPVIIIEKPEGTTTVSLESDDHFVNIFTDFASTIESKEFDAKYVELLTQSRLLSLIKEKSNTVSE